MNIDKIKERIKFFKQHEVIVSQTEEVEYLLAEIDRLTAKNERQELLITSLRQIIKERSDE